MLRLRLDWDLYIPYFSVQQLKIQLECTSKVVTFLYVGTTWIWLINVDETGLPFSHVCVYVGIWCKQTADAS